MSRGATVVKGKRRYDASGRQASAQRRREQILDAAEARFLAQGYGATTVGDIAEDAGVALDTIYKAFGGKAGLVRTIRDRALAGEGSVPAERRSDALHGQHLDGRAIINSWGGFLLELAPRVAPIMLLIRDAAVHDPEANALLDETDRERRQRMLQNARRLRDGGHLRPGVSVAHAADVLWTYSAAELYELLVLRRRWSVKRYAAFAADAMCAALL
jgi:AcrR family transcriptional regulator